MHACPIPFQEVGGNTPSPSSYSLGGLGHTTELAWPRSPSPWNEKTLSTLQGCVVCTAVSPGLSQHSAACLLAGSCNLILASATPDPLINGRPSRCVYFSSSPITSQPDANTASGYISRPTLPSGTFNNPEFLLILLL